MTAIQWEDRTDAIKEKCNDRFTYYVKGENYIILDGTYTFDELRDIIDKCERLSNDEHKIMVVK